VWGVYGLERVYADGHEQIGFLPAVGLQAIAEADSWLEELGLGDRIDYKVGAVAVHWRGLPLSEVEEIRSESYSKLAQLACAANLTLSEFNGGLELRLRGCDKGQAIQTMLAECDDDVAIAFLGDDTTDEAAFLALDGRGLSVLVQKKCRQTAAAVWLRPPEQLLKFLEDWIWACGGVR
jgi:trehalose 6-phosphate phosphatase